MKLADTRPLLVFYREALTREFEKEVFGGRASDKPQLSLEVKNHP